MSRSLKPADARRRVSIELQADATAVAGAAIDRIRAEIPAYRDLRGGQLADVRSIAAWSITRLVQLWSGPSEVGGRDRARFRAVGAARAADGRPLTDVLRAYRVASAVLVEYIVTAYRDQLDTGDVADLAVSVLNVVDDVSEAIIAGHAAGRDRLTHDRVRARAELLDDLLVARHSSPGALADRTRELGIELPTHPLLLVVQAVERDHPITPADLDEITDDLGVAASVNVPREPGHLATVRGRRGILLLPAVTGPHLETACADRAWRGCLIAGQAISHVGRGYRLATGALDTAPAHAYAGRALLDEGDAQLLALLTARPDADPDAVVRTVLGPLADRGHRHLLAGVAAFTTTGTATGAAATLHLHPQTLRYRLRRARELTGRDPRDPWHRLALDTALQLRQLAEHR